MPPRREAAPNHSVRTWASPTSSAMDPRQGDDEERDDWDERHEEDHVERKRHGRDRDEGARAEGPMPGVRARSARESARTTGHPDAIGARRACRRAAPPSWIRGV